ncbi:MAG TPA: hypothetical protein VF210_08495 [Pseudomonadales bacterium]
MGLLDLPAPLFERIDALLGVLPALLRLLLWGSVGGAISMWLYGVLSPQERIARSKREQLEVRRRLDGFDGELAEAWPMIRRLLGLSLGHLGRVIGPALLAALPVILLLVWISNAYGYRFPEREPPPLQVQPEELRAAWIASPEGPPQVEVRDSRRELLARVPVAVPVPVIEKRRWWNTLIGNPAGYLGADARVDRVSIELPRQQVIGFGPDWMRGWEVPFFAAVLVASLILKRALRLE